MEELIQWLLQFLVWTTTYIFKALFALIRFVGHRKWSRFRQELEDIDPDDILASPFKSSKISDREPLSSEAIEQSLQERHKQKD